LQIFEFLAMPAPAPQMTAFSVLAAVLTARSALAAVPIATFDGAQGTTWPWEPVNDPVMGGQSKSTFKVDSANNLGVWDGEVKIVPFLHAPGFCNLQAPGLGKKEQFPDVTGTDGFVARLKAEHGGLTHFNVMIMTKGARHLSKEGVYNANINLTSKMKDHFVPWSAFSCSWRGQPVTWCPELTTQLAQVDSVGFGTAFPGSAGKFHVEVESMSADKAPRRMTAGDSIDLATFDGKAPHTWHSENDPVMGGQSSSKFTVADGYGVYSGTCRIVPALAAPGFTIAMTESSILGHFPDASSMDGLVLGLRNTGGNISSYKLAFCDSRLNLYRCQFGTFKADFEIPPSSDFQEVFVPWAKFSDKWSATTGERTAENPPKASSLKSITQLQIWTEGVLGDFELQLKYVRAAKAPSANILFVV